MRGLGESLTWDGSGNFMRRTWSGCRTDIEHPGGVFPAGARGRSQGLPNGRCADVARSK